MATQPLTGVQQRPWGETIISVTSKVLTTLTIEARLLTDCFFGFTSSRTLSFLDMHHKGERCMPKGLHPKIIIDRDETIKKYESDATFSILLVDHDFTISVQDLPHENYQASFIVGWRTQLVLRATLWSEDKLFQAYTLLIFQQINKLITQVILYVLQTDQYWRLEAWYLASRPIVAAEPLFYMNWFPQLDDIEDPSEALQHLVSWGQRPASAQPRVPP